MECSPRLEYEVGEGLAAAGDVVKTETGRPVTLLPEYAAYIHFWRLIRQVFDALTDPSTAGSLAGDPPTKRYLKLTVIVVCVPLHSIAKCYRHQWLVSSATSSPLEQRILESMTCRMLDGATGTRRFAVWKSLLLWSSDLGLAGEDPGMAGEKSVVDGKLVRGEVPSAGRGVAGKDDPRVSSTAGGRASGAGSSGKGVTGVADTTGAGKEVLEAWEE